MLVNSFPYDNARRRGVGTGDRAGVTFPHYREGDGIQWGHLTWSVSLSLYVTKVELELRYLGSSLDASLETYCSVVALPLCGLIVLQLQEAQVTESPSCSHVHCQVCSTRRRGIAQVQSTPIPGRHGTPLVDSFGSRTFQQPYWNCFKPHSYLGFLFNLPSLSPASGARLSTQSDGSPSLPRLPPHFLS